MARYFSHKDTKTLRRLIKLPVNQEESAPENLCDLA
jgi:hypothetical protein